MPRRIAVVTGTRAEYGLSKGLLNEIQNEPSLKLHLIVTGAHLERKFGETWKEIESDGFAIDSRVPLQISGDTPSDIAAAMGRAITGITNVALDATPDLMVLLGDRYETFAAAQAAALCRIPIGHIHGGERTEGAIDDAFRHAITKLSHLHFASCDEYLRRIVQLGESPKRVFNVGSLGVDAIHQLDLPNLEDVERFVGLPLRSGYALITYHPSTLEADGGWAELEAMLAAIDEIPDLKNIITGVNADPGYALIAQRLDEYAAQRPNRVRLVASMGQRHYLAAMKYCRVVVGNSSSGIIEAPSLRVPTVNVGARQKGRLRAASVIDCGPDVKSIRAALGRALSPEFRSGLSTLHSPYGEGGAAKRILAVLRDYPLAGIIQKTFHDSPVHS